MPYVLKAHVTELADLSVQLRVRNTLSHRICSPECCCQFVGLLCFDAGFCTCMRSIVACIDACITVKPADVSCLTCTAHCIVWGHVAPPFCTCPAH